MDHCSHADDVMMLCINLQLTRGRHYSPITTKCITMSLKQQHNICQSNGEMVFATKIQGTKRTQSINIIYMIIDCIQIIEQAVENTFTDLRHEHFYNSLTPNIWNDWEFSFSWPSSRLRSGQAAQAAPGRLHRARERERQGICQLVIRSSQCGL